MYCSFSLNFFIVLANRTRAVELYECAHWTLPAAVDHDGKSGGLESVKTRHLWFMMFSEIQTESCWSVCSELTVDFFSPFAFKLYVFLSFCQYACQNATVIMWDRFVRLLENSLVPVDHFVTTTSTDKICHHTSVSGWSFRLWMPFVFAK